MTLTTSKYWLQAENDRNTHNGDVFISLVQRAFGVDEVVMVGHHFVFEPSSAMAARDLSKLNEIPSADTMLFDHEIMGAVFGKRAIDVMVALAKVPVSERDELLRQELAHLDAQREIEQAADRDVNLLLGSN